MMRFNDPWYFLLLLTLIPYFYFFRQKGGKIRFSSLNHVKKIIFQNNHQGHQNKFLSYFHPRQILTLLRLLALIFFIIALARPQKGKYFSEIDSEGVDIMLAIDTSGSMKALDLKYDNKNVDRLFVVKKVAEDFIKKRPGDRIGLVVFGSESYTQCPLTVDHGILLDFLQRMEIGMAGEATAIGSAIGTSVKRMKDLKAKSKIIILLTDGSNNAGRINPTTAAELAQTFGIKIYTIGVGSDGKAPFLMETFFGPQYVYQEVEMDEGVLQEIASITKAKYFRASDTEQLKSIYNEIDQLEKTEIKVKEYTEYHELFPYFLLFAVIFLVMEIILSQTKLRKIP